MVPLQNAALIRQCRITNLDLDQKAVQLRLRQWISPFKLQRILRRKHREVVIQQMCLAIHRHLPLLHTLLQRRLDLDVATHTLEFTHSNLPLSISAAPKLRSVSSLPDSAGRGRALSPTPTYSPASQHAAPPL